MNLFSFPSQTCLILVSIVYKHIREEFEPVVIATVVANFYPSLRYITSPVSLQNEFFLFMQLWLANKSVAYLLTFNKAFTLTIFISKMNILSS